MKNRLKIVAYGKDTGIPKSLSNYMYTRKGTQIDARYFKAAIEDTLYDDDGNYIGKLDAKKICDELNTDRDTLRTFTPYSSSGNNVKILATDYMGNEDIISITNLLNESLLIEDLKRWDKKEFRDNSNCYELEMLYESNKSMLSSQQKNELSRFVRKARTAEEINTYMTGMLAQSTNESLTEETAQERTVRRFQEIEADNERKRKEIEQNYEPWSTSDSNPDRPKKGDTVWVMSGGKRPGGVDPIRFEKRKSAGGGFYYGEDGWIHEWHNMWKEKNSTPTESLAEEVDEAFDKPPHEFWYYTKHGLGPGTVPRDVEILDVYEDDNWGTYIKLDKVLTTDELNYYDLKEKVPEGLE